ncbi:MAG: SDR family NAD(P)-dependent oxidoreductase [Planctomycetes bacterium]|nr:SDR family NAD(P)-dependent oxidoreductase [Planctomycetota bacterium]MCP4770202.1 SDR family NAD(P)-dependent oxidoreductase [Planctomycetota bacterium]MCP4860650.1 SDR family NAD(P)-dependent oxidoreductase [Planctomycetota bacterium]
MHKSPFEVPDLSGQVAVITGASRGIGKNIALALASAGADIVIAAKSEKSRELLPGNIHDTATEVEALGRQALAVKTNVRNADEIEAMVAAAMERFGRIDILVNNAGALHWKGVAETPPKRFDLMMEVNARAAHFTSHFVLPHMMDRGSGCIVQMSPPLDLSMLPGKTGYCMSKFGMSLLAMGIAGEVVDSEIRSCALWPATAIESQATINHGLGGPAQWRRADILSDSMLGILQLPREQIHGRCLIDEDVMEMLGVKNLEQYNCVEGGQPLRIVGSGGVQSRLWQS